MEQLKLIYSWLSKLNKISSLYSIAVGVCFFGIASVFLGMEKGFYIAITAFSVSCYLELLHSKAKTRITERNQSGDWEPIYDNAPPKNLLSMKILRHFDYEGFRFNVIVFDNSTVPFDVAGPLCPRPECDSRFLTSATKIKFPGRAVMLFKCSCGFCKEAKKTRAELYQEARELCGANPRTEA